MNLKDVIAKLPEADRGEAEKVIADAIAAGNPLAGIDSQEKAAELIKSNPWLKSAKDAEISKTIEAHDKDVIPKKVKDEMAKLNAPETDPLKLRVAELEARDKQREADIKRERLMNVAVKKAADMGIPIEDIHRFIDEDEDRTGAAVEAFAKRWKAYSEKAVEAALKEKLGNNGQPRGGNTTPPADLKTQYEAASKSGNGVEMLRLKGLMQAANTQE